MLVQRWKEPALPRRSGHAGQRQLEICLERGVLLAKDSLADASVAAAICAISISGANGTSTFLRRGLSSLRPRAKASLRCAVGRFLGNRNRGGNKCHFDWGRRLSLNCMIFLPYLLLRPDRPALRPWARHRKMGMSRWDVVKHA